MKIKILLYMLVAGLIISCKGDGRTDVSPQDNSKQRHASPRIAAGCTDSQYVPNLLISPNPRTICCAGIYDPSQTDDLFTLGSNVPITWNSNVAGSPTIGINFINIDSGEVVVWDMNVPNTGQYTFQSLSSYGQGRYQVTIYSENSPSCVFQNAYRAIA